MKIDKTLHKDIIEAYTIDLWSMREIAKVINTSPSSIHYVLNKHGIDTSKHLIDVSCTVCHTIIKRNRKRVRKQLNHFCNEDCYYAFLDAGKTSYVSNRHSQRVARSIVSKYFDLKEENVIHHENRDCLDNRLLNLKVFATQGDHMRYHHTKRDEYYNQITDNHRDAWFRCHKGFKVEPIWSGSAS